MTPPALTRAYLLGFLAATFGLQWSGIPAWTWIVATGLAAIACARMRRCMIVPMVIAASLGAAMAVGNVARTTHVPTALDIEAYATGTEVTVRGSIADEPDRRPMQAKYAIAVEEITTASGTVIRPVRGTVLATDHRMFPRYAYGDRVAVTGTLERPGAIEEFRYDRYLELRDIRAVMYRGSFAQTASGAVMMMGTLFAMKDAFESQINRLLPEPHASFMAGILTGSRRGLPEDVLEDFRITGLTHIIAISGFNITIVVSVIGGMLFWLPLRWRFIPAVAAIAAFTLFVGASAAVVRAAIMGSLGLLALQVGRAASVRIAILWTLFVMLLWNPEQLWWDAGFQLSFLAVLGLTELGPRLERWFRWAPEILGIREALQMTIAAQIMALPLLVLLFGQLSLIAPIANVLVAPFIPLAMLFGFVGTVTSLLWFPLGQLFAFAGYGCLAWVLFVSERLADIPYATLDIRAALF